MTARKEMIESSRSGNINGFYSAMEKYPKLLEEVDETKFVNTPLHEAAATGHTDFAIEILNLMPSFGKKLNPQGLSPLHVAIERGKSDTALALARFDKQLVRVKGKYGLTPLHYCAAKVPDISQDNEDKGLDLLAGLLVACPDSVFDVNNRFQTVIHVALETNPNDKAVSLLVEWLIRRAKEYVLSWKDEKGNAPIHTAAQHGRLEAVEKLANQVKINKRNFDGKTPLDIAIEYGKKDVEQALQKAGAKTEDYVSKRYSLIDYVKSKPTSGEFWTRTYYFLTREMKRVEMRDVFFVVAVLIFTATYQAVLQPPGGFYSAEGKTHRAAANRLEHPEGHMVMGKGYYRYFMTANTFSFVLSTVLIFLNLPGSPVIIALHFCLISMCISYLLALKSISNYNDISNIIFILSWFAIILGFSIKVSYYPIKALCVDESWWLRRTGARIDNFCHIFPGCVAKVLQFGRKMRRQYRLLDIQ